MNNEETIIDPQYASKKSNEVKTEAKQEEKKPINKQGINSAEKAAYAAGGAVFGAAATMAGQSFAAHAHNEEEVDPEPAPEPAPEPNSETNTDSTPASAPASEPTSAPAPEDSPKEEEVIVVTDEGIRVAHVDDDMSFSEAFAEARAQVGPGGVFEWHGKVYGTYYKNEWDNMSDEERSEWQSKIDYDDVLSDDSEQNQASEHHNSTSSHETHSSSSSHEHTTQESSHSQEPQPIATSGGASSAGNEDVDVQVLEVGYTDLNGDGAPEYSALVSVDGHEIIIVDIDQNGTADVAIDPSTGEVVTIEDQVINMPGTPDGNVYTAQNSQPVVEVIDVAQTDLNGDGIPENSALVSVDGHEAILVDVDMNGTADVIIDPNSGQMADISHDQIVMPDMASDDVYMAYNDSPDYVNDADTNQYV